jgi:hypothetical protein
VSTTNHDENQWKAGCFAAEEGLSLTFIPSKLKTLNLASAVLIIALRHSGASLLENNNVPVGVIQKVPGHENRSTTEIYLHNLGTSDREAMALREQSSRKKSHTQHHDSLSE